MEKIQKIFGIIKGENCPLQEGERFSSWTAADKKAFKVFVKEQVEDSQPNALVACLEALLKVMKTFPRANLETIRSEFQRDWTRGIPLGLNEELGIEAFLRSEGWKPPAQRVEVEIQHEDGDEEINPDPPSEDEDPESVHTDTEDPPPAESAPPPGDSKPDPSPPADPDPAARIKELEGELIPDELNKLIQAAIPDIKRLLAATTPPITPPAGSAVPPPPAPPDPAARIKELEEQVNQLRAASAAPSQPPKDPTAVLMERMVRMFEAMPQTRAPAAPPASGSASATTAATAAVAAAATPPVAASATPTLDPTQELLVALTKQVKSLNEKSSAPPAPAHSSNGGMPTWLFVTLLAVMGAGAVWMIVYLISIVLPR